MVTAPPVGTRSQYYSIVGVVVGEFLLRQHSGTVKWAKKCGVFVVAIQKIDFDLSDASNVDLLPEQD